MRYVECNCCGKRIYEGDVAYYDGIGKALCSDECVLKYYIAHLYFEEIYRNLHGLLNWIETDNNAEDESCFPKKDGAK